MLVQQIRRNEMEAFKHLVGVIKGQDINTISYMDGTYTYRTKRGIVKNYKVFLSYEAYAKSEYEGNRTARVNSFIFVEMNS